MFLVNLFRHGQSSCLLSLSYLYLHPTITLPILQAGIRRIAPLMVSLLVLLKRIRIMQAVRPIFFTIFYASAAKQADKWGRFLIMKWVM